MNRFLRSAVTGFLVGVIGIGAAFAGAELDPFNLIGGQQNTTASAVASGSSAASALAAIGTGETLGADELFVGASKVSIAPNPPAGERWETNRAKCLPVTTADTDGTLTHAADPKSPWIENPSCIYMGGYGLGPSNPIAAFDTEYGLWSRSVAFSKDGKALVLTILDGTSYFGKYKNMCLDCGAFDLSAQLGTELGLDPASFVFASTHSHTAPDFIGGWGGVPKWYMDQVANAMRQSVRQALTTSVPATLITGETIARRFNSERRDTYRSAEDDTINWIRAIGRDGTTNVATVSAYAAHPVTFPVSKGIAHADWLGATESRLESRFGGIGLVFQTGLGNISPRLDNKALVDPYQPAKELADLIPSTGTLVTNPNVRVKQVFWNQPITNAALGTLGSGGFFDRPMSDLAAAVSAGRSSTKPCRSASGVSVRTAVTAAKIGDLVITAAPGETFSNLTNTIEEKTNLNALAIAQANDGLGYIMQSFETDHTGRQVLGFAGANTFEYEDAYSIDACFGDMVLETTLSALAGL